MVFSYFAWWAQQMRPWIPDHLLGGGGSRPNALIVQADPGLTAIAMTLRSRPLGRFRLDPAAARALRAAVPPRPPATILRLPPGLLLECEIVLPLVAEREPARLLEYEMDRNTPFTAAEVFWSYAIERRDRARERLHLRLSVIAKAALEPLLAALAEAGVVPGAIEAMSVSGVARRIDLHHARRSALGRRLLAALGLLCGGLAVAAVALPFVMQALASRRVEGQIAQLQPRVAEAEALRRRVATAAAAVNVVAAERGVDGNPLDLLAAINDVLPDGTFLSEFALRQGKLTLTGQSASAARLIAALSGEPMIRNPAFAGPVTRIENDRADLFAIRAELAP